jgi:hypothetical protein
VLPVKAGATYLDSALFCCGNRFYGVCRTDLGTDNTVHAAVSALKAQSRLQHAGAMIKGAQYLIGTSGNAKLAASAAFTETLKTDGTGRYYRSFANESFFATQVRFFLFAGAPGRCRKAGKSQYAQPGNNQIAPREIRG